MKLSRGWGRYRVDTWQRLLLGLLPLDLITEAHSLVAGGSLAGPRNARRNRLWSPVAGVPRWPLEGVEGLQFS